jgi:hypothetical protein
MELQHSLYSTNFRRLIPLFLQWIGKENVPSRVTANKFGSQTGFSWRALVAGARAPLLIPISPAISFAVPVGVADNFPA